MRKHLTLSLICALLSAASAAQASSWFRSADRADDLDVVALTRDGRLVDFHLKRPGKVRVLATVSGLQGDARLVGIDYRVQDGRLYGVGDAGGVYTLDTRTGAATLVNRLSVTLSGTVFAVDFNPAADRLRIISNEGQNLRHNVNAGGVTVSDGALNYTAGAVATGVAAAAYTNNDLSATTTATTLFVLDAALDQVALQSPPNAGVLVGTGKLGVDAGADVGFDIYSEVREGVTVSNRGVAVITATNGEIGLYDVDLLTGRVTLRGPLSGDVPIIDMAIPVHQN